MSAVKYKHSSTAELLTALGSQVDDASMKYVFPVVVLSADVFGRFAIDNKLEDFVAILEKAKFFEAIKRGDAKTVQDQLAKYDFKTIRDGTGFSPLLVACGHGREHIVELFLKAGAGILP